MIYADVYAVILSHYPALTVDLNFQLSSLEEDFIYAAEFGDIPTVQRILDENPLLNVDFSDILGRTPLRLAVGNEHLEVSNANFV